MRTLAIVSNAFLCAAFGVFYIMLLTWDMLSGRFIGWDAVGALCLGYPFGVAAVASAAVVVVSYFNHN